MKNEQSVLRVSILATITIAVAGIMLGLMASSFSIMFEGVYAVADASMSGLALIVATLIKRDTSGSAGRGRVAKRFSRGFWHLEPLVLALNGSFLCGVSIYALLNAGVSIMNGGREIDFGYAIVYAAVTAAVSFSLAAWEFRLNRSIGSDFIALDAKAWIMAGGISSAMLVAFGVGALLDHSPYGWFKPYVDPSVLAFICIVIIPMPVLTICRALSDILLITPNELKAHVDQVAHRVVQENGFVKHEAYVAKVGRAQQIELYFIVPEGRPACVLEEWDRLRDEIGALVGGEGPNRWLTIAFTTDSEWAS
ncbi:cation diffusion facilitator family transporter [Pseudomonas monteilii]|uniref:cation diffusion facilitator family transporter n=1 Tax=Pseudomonas monteilii TaxID=76759 RepID=UPI00383A5B46